MLLLAASAVGAAAATAVAATNRPLGLALSVLAFAGIGIGISASRTPFLALLADRVDAERRSGAAALTWILMIVGIIVTAAVGGALLDPFSYPRLIAVTAGVCAVAVALTIVALIGNEPAAEPSASPDPHLPTPSFAEAFREVWAEDGARRFALLSTAQPTPTPGSVWKFLMWFGPQWPQPTTATRIPEVP